MNLTRPISQPRTSCGNLYASTSSLLTPSRLCQALDSPFTQKGRDLTSTLPFKSQTTVPALLAALLSITVLLLRCSDATQGVLVMYHYIVYGAVFV